jgi:hypothetical protein
MVSKFTGEYFSQNGLYEGSSHLSSLDPKLTQDGQSGST